ERSDQEGVHAHLRPGALMNELHEKEDFIRRSLGQAKGGPEPVIRWLALNRMGRDLDSWQPELNRMRWIHVVTRREKRSDLKAAVNNIAVYFKQLPRGNSLRYDLLGLTQGLHDELPSDEPLAWETEDLMLQEI